MNDVIIGRVTSWVEAEIRDCLGLDIDLDGNLIRRGDSYFIEVCFASRGDVTVEGSATISGKTAERVVTATQIENAQSIAELPAGFADADDDIRDLAKAKFEELEEDEEC